MRPTTTGAAAILLFASLAPVSSAEAALTCNGKPVTIQGISDGSEDIMGTPGDDVAWLGPGNNRFFGGVGDDTVCGGPGEDRVYLGPGNDWASTGGDFDTLYGGSGDDELHGGTGADYLYGDYEDGSWADSVPTTVDGSDRMFGGDSSDGLFMEAGVAGHTGGSDFAAGGPGAYDIISYIFSSGPVTLNVATQTGVGGAGVDTFASSEAYSGSPMSDTMYGSAAKDDLGGFFAEVGPGDRIFGYRGDDRISADRGWIYAGKGNDSASPMSLTGSPPGGGDGTLYIELGPGDDMTGMPDRQLASGQVTTYGQSGDDQFFGGFTSYQSNAGSVGFFGGRGVDLLSFHESTRPVTLDVNARTASWYHGSVNFHGMEMYRGGQVADRFYGSSGAERLYGSGGKDLLVGRGGPDLLTGNKGIDTANGGAGRDTCRAEHRIACELQ